MFLSCLGGRERIAYAIDVSTDFLSCLGGREHWPEPDALR